VQSKSGRGALGIAASGRLQRASNRTVGTARFLELTIPPDIYVSDYNHGYKEQIRCVQLQKGAPGTRMTNPSISVRMKAQTARKLLAQSISGWLVQQAR